MKQINVALEINGQLTAFPVSVSETTLTIDGQEYYVVRTPRGRLMAWSPGRVAEAQQRGAGLERKLADHLAAEQETVEAGEQVKDGKAEKQPA